jgi:hypothetical protein
VLPHDILLGGRCGDYLRGAPETGRILRGYIGIVGGLGGFHCRENALIGEVEPRFSLSRSRSRLLWRHFVSRTARWARGVLGRGF